MVVGTEPPESFLAEGAEAERGPFRAVGEDAEVQHVVSHTTGTSAAVTGSHDGDVGDRDVVEAGFARQGGDDLDGDRGRGDVDRLALHARVVGELLVDAGAVVEPPGHLADAVVLEEAVLPADGVGLVVAGDEPDLGDVRRPGRVIVTVTPCPSPLARQAVDDGDRHGPGPVPIGGHRAGGRARGGADRVRRPRRLARLRAAGARPGFVRQPARLAPAAEGRLTLALAAVGHARVGDLLHGSLLSVARWADFTNPVWAMRFQAAPPSLGPLT